MNSKENDVKLIICFYAMITYFVELVVLISIFYEHYDKWYGVVSFILIVCGMFGSSQFYTRMLKNR